jgi:hypothetical protein
MSNPTSNFGWQMPTPTDLVTDLPADFEVFGQAVDSDFADLLGGTTGQVLSKTSNTDLDFTWVAANPGDITGVTAGTGISGGGTSGTVTVTNDMATTITASGDIVVGTGSGTYDNLPIGTTGQLLTADTTVSPYKVKWATPAASASGLTLVKQQTIGTSVSTVTVSSAFNSSYDNYRILISGGSGANDGSMFLRLGSTTSDYYLSGFYQTISATTTLNAYGLVNSNSFNCGYMSTNGMGSMIDINMPNAADETIFSVKQITTKTGGNLAFYQGFLNNTTSYTAFTVNFEHAQTGGEIRVYGYQNS